VSHRTQALRHAVNPGDTGRRVVLGQALGLALGAHLPSALASAPSASPVFVLNSQDANVSVIDPASWKLRSNLPTGKEPHHLYLAPDDRTLIVANAASNSLTFIDPTTAELRRTVHGVIDPYHLRFSPDMRWFVTAANRLDHIDLYRWQGASAAEPLQLVRRIAAPKTPSHLAIDSASRMLYASLQDSDEWLSIDLATQAVRLKQRCGRMPADLFLSADDRTLLVALTGDRVVEAWDVSSTPARLVRRIETGAGAHAFRARGDGRHVFVSNRVGNSISEIDTRSLSVVGQWDAPGGPDCMDLMSDGRTLLVTSRWAKKLSVIDLVDKRLVRQVPVGRSPHGVWTLDHAPRQ
jgi:DNA-binding beta-propeller fold protein YncE